MHRVAIPGGRFSNRVSVHAVGRRGHFSEGRFSPNFCNEAPPGNAPSGGAKRPRRPGMRNSTANRYPRKTGLQELRNCGPGMESSVRLLIILPSPAFGSALRPLRTPTTTDRSRSVISLKGDRVVIGRASPLREMTSAAYTVGRDSVSEVTAEGCQARFFL
jgi:hypothetical protein